MLPSLLYHWSVFGATSIAIVGLPLYEYGFTSIRDTMKNIQHSRHFLLYAMWGSAACGLAAHYLIMWRPGALMRMIA